MDGVGEPPLVQDIGEVHDRPREARDGDAVDDGAVVVGERRAMRRDPGRRTCRGAVTSIRGAERTMPQLVSRRAMAEDGAWTAREHGREVARVELSAAWPTAYTPRWMR